ncbi:MAG TPA: hypothetical protein VGR96_06355 [Acidobacteriaceae bacterium]|nr:hypothetical protein [Acidobacteriaceae bacterium]
MRPFFDERTSNLIEQSNRIGVQFLLADLNTGLTFTQVASVTESAVGRTRNFDKALEVYRTVTRLLPRVLPSPDEQLQIQTRLGDLKCRLEQAGYQFED